VGEFADPTTIRTFPKPDLPGGAAGGVDFDPEAEQIADAVEERGIPVEKLIFERGPRPLEAGKPDRGLHRDRGLSRSARLIGRLSIRERIVTAG
jgi:hypothetical protein